MKHHMTKILATSLAAAGLMLAQTAQPSPEPRAGSAPRIAAEHPGAPMMARLNQLLNLTPDQQAQARQIFHSAHAGTRPLAAQMREARSGLASAVKANAPDADIDRLSNNIGTLASQMAAARAKSFAKFYSILNEDQKNRLNGSMDQFLNHGMRG